MALWWLYFDLSGAAAKRGIQDEGHQARISVHDRYVFAHLPLAAGLVAVGVGIEHTITDLAHAGLVLLALTLVSGVIGGLARRETGDLPTAEV